MHLLRIPDDISEPIPVEGGKAMEAGKAYLVTNAFAGAMLQSNWRVVINGEMWGLSPLLKVRPFQDAEGTTANLAGKHVWLIRGGGYGDLMMMTPLIRQIKKRWPTCVVHVACGKQYHGLFKNLDVRTEEIPIELDDSYPGIGSPGFGRLRFYSFEGWIEGHPNAEKVHMAQQFADKFGIDLQGDHRPDFLLDVEEITNANRRYPRTDRKRVGVQYLASALCRSYPFINKVIAALEIQGYEIYLFGAPGSLTIKPENEKPNVKNLTEDNLDFRESAAVLTTCDCVISPDSALIHLSSALDIPCVGLYGAFPPNLRMSGENRQTKMIQGTAPCAPCFYHAARPTDFPAGMPCSVEGYCVAIGSITPEQITEEVTKICSPIIQLDHRIRM